MKKYRKCKFLEIVPNDNCVEFDEYNNPEDAFENWYCSIFNAGGDIDSLDESECKFPN